MAQDFVTSSDKLHLCFQGLNAAVELDQSDALLSTIREAMPNWHFEAAPFSAERPICARINRISETRFRVEVFDGTAEPTEWDSVNTVCQLIGQLAWEQLRSSPHVLCLHAAAVEYRGKLILIPNSRRAGKSTLCALLAHQGLRIFSDDFVMLHANEQGHLCGYSNGVLPRIRLPLPKSFPSDVRDWIAQQSGPKNRQYQYIASNALPPRNEPCPVGAVVFLDRQSDAEQPVLQSVPDGAAIDQLLHQNFARSIHSGVSLTALHDLVASVPTLSLTYREAPDAAQHLLEALDRLDLPTARLDNYTTNRPPEAEFQTANHQTTPLDEMETYTQARGVTRVSTETEDYLSDSSGLGVYRLNAGSAAIWQILSIPASAQDVITILQAAFPDVPPSQIQDDALQTLTQFARARLIETALATEGELA